MKGAIWKAYADTCALEVTCPHCGAEPGQWCTKSDGRVRRVPCVDRAESGIVTDSGKPYARDFTEPIHPTN
jgi:hypothetical protein